MADLESVCVTGGAGFIGSHIVDALPSATRVTIYDNLSTGDSNNVPSNAEFIEGDIQDRDHLVDAVARSDVVFHEAAQVSVKRSVENPVQSRKINLDPVLTILEAARDTDTRVVFASSAAIYGEPEYTPVDEGHPKNPNSPYGLEKLSADHYCRMYSDLYGVEAVALRYFNVYGPHQQASDYSGVISIFREQALNDEPITIEGDGMQTRDFVHVDDIVQANLLAATSDEAPGKAFNIGTGNEITIYELADTIRDVTNSDSELVHIEPREGDIEKSVADIGRARKTLGYEPEYEIHEGIEEYLEEENQNNMRN